MYMYVYLCICIFVCIYAYTHTQIYICVYVCMYVCMYVFVCMYVCKRLLVNPNRPGSHRRATVNQYMSSGVNEYMYVYTPVFVCTATDPAPIAGPQ